MQILSGTGSLPVGSRHPVGTRLQVRLLPFRKRKRREEAGPAGEELIRQGTNDWAALWAEYRAEMERGTDPADLRVQALEQRRRALVSAFSGGDAGVEHSLKRMWTEQGDKLCAQYGYDPKLLAYLGKVSEAGKGTG